MHSRIDRIVKKDPVIADSRWRDVCHDDHAVDSDFKAINCKDRDVVDPTTVVIRIRE